MEPAGTDWNQLEPVGTGWNRLEPAGTGWNLLEPAGTGSVRSEMLADSPSSWGVVSGRIFFKKRWGLTRN